MVAHPERRRVLLAAAADAAPALTSAFAHPALAGWEHVTCQAFEQARFAQQHDACDVLVVDETLYRAADSDSLGWLGLQQEVPVVVLADPGMPAVADALASGPGQWLPRGLSLEYPPMLAAALNHALRWSEPRRQARLTHLALQECRRQVDRLVGMLWEAAPIDTATRLCTQRHMMDRLHEEIARADRYGAPLSIALTEFTDAGGDGASLLPTPLTSAMAECVLREKRKSDVAGQYGPHGVLLLLVHTPGNGALTCCRRLRSQLNNRVGALSTAPRPPAAHFGIATFSTAMPTPQAMLRAAEEHLEEAKAGRGSELAL